MAKKFAVIDTETNWSNEVMSIGAVVAEDGQFDSIDFKYIIIPEATFVGGMYSFALKVKGLKSELLERKKAVSTLLQFLEKNEVSSLYAYNASFDAKCLPELRNFEWHDILKLAAYKQHNPAIPACAQCFGTGRLKRGYGVEDIMHLFGEKNYFELHNALTDAVDELRIMKYLNHPIHKYPLI
jgi:DNA polymerase III epsilon subunit-like protein